MLVKNMYQDEILIRGAKEHNLKNIDVRLPRFKLVVITGVSCSGKLSFSFDTLYAEGQRRYIESLSAYALQFLERMEKPDAEIIEGITPAIAIQQKAVTKNPRSTVATVTEIYDFLRVLYARIGIVHCQKCNEPVQRETIDSIIETLFKLSPDTKALITFSWPKEKGLEALQRDGFSRVVQKGKIRSLDQADLSTGQLNVLVDRISLDPSFVSSPSGET